MKENNQTTEQIAGFRRGHLQAIRVLYATHFSPLLYFAERIIRDRVTAREIVVETFIKLLNRRAFFDNEADIKAFLFITARNTCMDFLRSGKSGRPAEEAASEVKETELDFADANNMAAAYRVMQEAFDNLPATWQQVFNMLFVEAVPAPAAARQLDMDPREMLIYRKKAIHQLQDALREHDLFSAPFFIHYLTVACRKKPAEQPVAVNR